MTKYELASILISSLALIIVLLKDFILPFFYKPKFEFKYEDNVPYRRDDVNLLSSGGSSTRNSSTFLRFSAKNVGGSPARNCRCQVLSISSDTPMDRDYEGFPLRWACRPEAMIDQAKGERLNIGIKEKEFLDLAYTTDSDVLIYLQKYHNIPIGIPETIIPGTYDIKLIFSGDNFKPYILQFRISKENSQDPLGVSLELIQSTQL